VLFIARHTDPPKNGLIALWPNTRVVKCKYSVSQKQNGFNNKVHWYNILLIFISKFTDRLYGLKYLYSVISVIDKRLPGNTKKWTLVRSWTARVRLVHPWADRVMMIAFITIKSILVPLIEGICAREILYVVIIIYYPYANAWQYV